MTLPRYGHYKDSGVDWLGEVPAHWQVTRLKFIAHVQTGIAKGKDNTGKDTVDVPYLRVANVQDGYLDLEDVATIEIPVDDLPRYQLRAGDVLMNEGGDFDKLGRGHVWDGSIDPCIHQNHVFAVRPFGASPQWLNLITGSAYAQFYFMSRSKQSTNLASISSTNVMELPVVMPPAAEQERIAAFLSLETTTIDSLIDEQRRLIELQTEKRQAVVAHAVTKGLNPAMPMKESGVDWIGEVPSHWYVGPLRRAFSAMDYGISDSLDVAGAVAVLRMGNIRGGAVDLDDLKFVGSVPEELLLRAGDLLFNRTNSLDQIGKVGLFTHESAAPTSFASYLVRLRTVATSIPEYFAYLLNSSGVLGEAQANAIVAIGQCNLNPTRYGAFTVPIPPHTEQVNITAFLDQKCGALDRLTSEAESAIRLLKERRTALVSAAVTGQIDVRCSAARAKADAACAPHAKLMPY